MGGDLLQIGVLALQGGVREHMEMLGQTEQVRAREVRRPADLDQLDGIVLPGGESTTIGKLLVENDLLLPLRRRLAEGMPAYGTCAGMILLARGVTNADQPGLGVMDISVERNAFGSQLDSFEADLPVSGMDGGAFHAIFIRAPRIERTGPQVRALAALPDGTVVAARQGNLLASAFHPELGSDPRFHALFLGICSEEKVRATA